MRKRVLSVKQIERYIERLRIEEKAEATLEKYRRDIYAFFNFLPPDKMLKKELLISYKKHLKSEKYAVSSINSMLVAVNGFVAYLGASDCKVKLFKQQRSTFCDENRELTREEYLQLVQAAQQKKDNRLALILQTICSTGIRVSELKYITVQALQKQEARVQSKGKLRKILLPKILCVRLLRYCRERSVRKGSVFVSRNGNPLDRTSIWASMKKLCRAAKVAAQKVFPHNLRHLFARTFYRRHKDIVRLADVLGHSSVDTTRIYTLTSGKEQMIQLEKLHLLA
ncbi:tyrosine-type recombinase/integrase [uncultured Ruthenibacterium sp.]|uniref:tyrosine-type recombinase/integrase n=1 Tax=uncultured Ruthenibacterium sp. TaxID=1905347 RepID=UPI00349E71DF